MKINLCFLEISIKRKKADREPKSPCLVSGSKQKTRKKRKIKFKFPEKSTSSFEKIETRQFKPSSNNPQYKIRVHHSKLGSISENQTSTNTVRFINTADDQDEHNPRSWVAHWKLNDPSNDD